MPQEFQIKSLRDIFELPHIEQMVTCLDEMKVGMLQTRKAADLMVNMVPGATIAEHVEWPEQSTWIDDGKNNITTAFTAEGETFIELKTKTEN